jgi:membrane protein YfhO
VLPLVLRLLAVYFGTAAGALWLANRFVSPLRVRTGILLAFGPFLLVGPALVTAGIHAPVDITYLSRPLSVRASEEGTSVVQTPMLSDVVYQEIPWRKAVRDAAKNGRLPLWNRSVLAGEPLLAVQQPVVLHPATWIGFLLPLAQAWTFEMALRYFLALLCAYLFLRELGCGETPALLGAVGWAFCDYLVFFLGYPLTPAAAPLPLLMLGLRRLAREPGRRAAALTVISLLLILTSGHPESLLHCVAGAGIWFLFELAAVDRARRRRGLAISLVAGALTLGIAAVLLVPLLEALPHTVEHEHRAAVFAHAKRSEPLGEALRRSLPDLQPYAFGFAGRGRFPAGYQEPGTYAGALLWPFALAGIFSSRREKWGLLAIGLLGAAVGARFPVISDAVAKLPLFAIGINDRMAFLGAFATAALAALGAQWILEEKRRRLAVAASVAGAALAWALYAGGAARLAAGELSSEFLHGRIVAQVLPLAGAAVLFAVVPRRRFAAALGGCLLLLLVERGFEEGGVYPTYPSRAFYPNVPAFDPVPRSGPWRFTAVGFEFIPNIATLYDLEDVRGYEAMTFRPLAQTFSLWCIPQVVWYNRVDDPTRPFLSFLNVRWVFAAPEFQPPAGWPVRYRGPEGMLLENPAVLPRAFAPESYRAEADEKLRVALLGEIRDFRAQGVVADGAPPSEGWVRNGAAAVTVAGYEPQRLRLAIDAAAPAVVGTSVTAWPGWKLSIDGRRAPLLSYNHAFVGFRVPAGRHEAVLRYLPDSFLAGAAISFMSLAASLLLLRFPRLPAPLPR